LANGAPLPELEPDLVEVLADKSFPHTEREDAAQALIKLGGSGKNATVQQYANLDRSGDEIRIRANILIALYGDKFGPVEAAELLIDAINLEDELSIGSLSSLPDRIPLADIPLVLDRLEPKLVRAGADENWRNSEGFYTFDRLLLRVLKESPENTMAQRLRPWLGFRMAMSRFELMGLEEQIKMALTRRSAELHNLARHFLSTLQIDEERLRHLREFDELTLGIIDRDDLLDWYCDYLNEAQQETEKEEFVYEIALSSSYRATERATKRFEWLWELGDERPTLKVVRNNNLSLPIPDWQRERGETVARRAAERAEKRAKNRLEFEEHQVEIRSGASVGWLEWLANIYFCRFRGIDGKKTRRDRLVI
jgi:hypothetical protein